MHGRYIGRGLCRSVFFGWIAGNAIRALAADLEAKFPSFREGMHDGDPSYVADHQRADLDRLSPLYDVAFWAAWGCRDSRDALDYLRWTFPRVRDQAAALRVRFPEPEDD